jgi:hypothetical protein
MYTRFRHDFFDASDRRKLPPPGNLEFFWYRDKNLSFAKTLFERGTNRPIGLGLNDKLQRPFWRKIAAIKIVHEMVHLLLGPDVDCQDFGGDFDKAMLRAVNEGAFLEFW